jgi:predicted permease
LTPAWQLAHADLNATLKDGTRGATDSSDRGRLRGLLVVSEIALSLVLLIGAGLMTRSFVRMAHIDRGFQPARLLTAGLDFSVSGFTTWIEPSSTRPQVTLKEIMEQIRIQPGVRSVAVASKLPHDVGSARIQTVLIENRPTITPGESPTADFQGISPDYFRALGVPLLRGRALAESDKIEAPKVALINEAMAKRYFPNEDPIGKHLSLEDPKRTGQPVATNPNAPASPWIEIVGVVPDVKNLGLNAESAPTVYVSYWQWPMQSPTLLLRSNSDPSALAGVIRGAVKAVNQNLPEPRIQTMDQILAETYAEPRFYTLLSLLFGITALILAVVGVYGVLSYTVTQRIHEIGIRMALGAREGNVLSLVIGKGMRLVLLGVSAGILASLGLTRVMRSLLYEVTPTDPFTFFGASLLLASVALLACWLPARRATKVEPTAALRDE